jgi:hypothetical protein
VDANVNSAVVIRIGIVRQVRPVAGGHNRFTHTVLHEVVIEIGTRSQAENQVGDLRFRVVGNVPHVA